MNGEQYRELLFNASGYYDSTAGKAIKNVIKEEKQKMNMQVVNGDIWTMQRSNGGDCEVLILATHENYASILTLCPNTMSGAITVKGKVPMYTDPGKVNYAFYDRLQDYVKSVSEAELKKVLEKVGFALGLDAYQPPKDTERITQNKTEKKEPDKTQPAQENTVNNAKIADMHEQLAVALKERDIYKELFYKACPQMQ